MRRLMAQRQERRDRAVENEPVATGFSGQQELEQKAQAAAVSRAGVQAVEACSTSQAATLQTGSACEDRDALDIFHLVKQFAQHIRFLLVPLRPESLP